ncbi:MAG: hypothetical protein A2341_21220 [Deltaproteobacteria bacterium RIFOXYB12_FULL_58_9]|nr:MAG: hypothetical protein A2341_21220 [Deltaproteobacteria bacterium RIFOXYB12_FULL_58_9]
MLVEKDRGDTGDATFHGLMSNLVDALQVLRFVRRPKSRDGIQANTGRQVTENVVGFNVLPPV